MHALLELTDVSLKTPTGRALFEGLNLSIGKEQVALVGRNGVGKSTLLSLLAGATEAASGRVRVQSRPHYVAQADELEQPLSRGELRKLSLQAAQASGADILLLDEPTLHGHGPHHRARQGTFKVIDGDLRRSGSGSALGGGGQREVPA